MAIDKSDFDIWMESPVTKDILKSIGARKDGVENYLQHERSFLDKGYDHNRSLAMNNYYKGMMDAYSDLVNITFNDFSASMEDESDE